MSGRDESGHQVEVWVLVANAWAALDPLRGSEYFAAEQAQAETTHRVTMRAQPGHKVVAHRYRVVFEDSAGDRIFDVEQVRDIEERGAYLEMLCREVAA